MRLFQIGTLIVCILWDKSIFSIDGLTYRTFMVKQAILSNAHTFKEKKKEMSTFMSLK